MAGQSPRPAMANPSRTASVPLEQPMATHLPRSTITSPSRAAAISLEQPTADHDPDSNCPICHESIKDLTTLHPCGHKFCYECIRKWFSLRPAITPTCCPLYRIEVKELRHQYIGEAYKAERATESEDGGLQLSGEGSVVAAERVHPVWLRLYHSWVNSVLAEGMFWQL